MPLMSVMMLKRVDSFYVVIVIDWVMMCILKAIGLIIKCVYICIQAYIYMYI